jgi:hypothetical protein
VSLGQPRSHDREIQVRGLRFLLGPDEARNVDRYRGVRVEYHPGLLRGQFEVVPTYGGMR